MTSAPTPEVQSSAQWLQPKKHLSNPEQALQERLAFLVGCTAVALPVLLFLGGLLPNVCFRNSISHFYYDPFFGPVFVGLLFFIGGFMIALTGETLFERAGSLFAGVGAFFVATFPTSDSGCEKAVLYSSRVFSSHAHEGAETVQAINGGAFFNLFSNAPNLHLVGAGIVFLFLGLYCIIVLRRVVKPRHAPDGFLLPSKHKRNRLYFACGVTIIACVAVLGLKGKVLGDAIGIWDSYNLTFFVEALALWAFALAWFAKGRSFPSLNDGTPASQLIK